MHGLSWIAVAFIVVMANALDCTAQQKGQWVPGQYGLNAGVVPEPGFTYLNLAINYSADALNDANGNRLPAVTGTYEFWVDENIFMFVPKKKILGGYYAPFVSVNVANGSLVADLGNLFGTSAGGTGLADTLVVPVNFGWHFPRADFSVGYAFIAPTGRFTAGASDNVGSGYWGNHLISGTTVYLTKNKGTSANLFVDWEGHGKKSGTNITPGQAFTMEWGLGQALPLDKKMYKLLQIGLVGYDQWQVSDNSGITAIFPHYSVHALGFQTNFIVPAKGLNFFFKYYGEYSALSHPQGRTIAFGGSWTLKIPKK
jgi:hypothetical protein